MLPKSILRNKSYQVKSIISQNKRTCICVVENNDNKCYILKKIYRDELYNTEIDIIPYIQNANDNIIKILSYEHNYNTNLLLIEYCTYGNLNVFLENFGNSEKSVKLLLHNITNAIEYLHGQNIIHRDIKPDNILVTLKDDMLVFKLSDFGFACLDGSEITMEKDNHTLYSNYFIKCGTPYYMAPELLNNYAMFNKKVDIWSFGICIYEFINKKKLLRKFKTIQDLKKITQDYINKKLEINDIHRDILVPMLNTDPILRASIYEIKIYINKNLMYEDIEEEPFELNVSDFFLKWLDSYS